MLTNEQIDAIAAHMDKHWAKKACPMCGANDWQVSGPVLLLQAGGVKARRVIESSSLAPRKATPVAAVGCKPCGYTALINLISAGLVDPD